MLSYLLDVSKLYYARCSAFIIIVVSAGGREKSEHMVNRTRQEDDDDIIVVTEKLFFALARVFVRVGLQIVYHSNSIYV